MIEYIQGNLLETNANIIAHGCNASGGFGSGLAKQISDKYPAVRDLYKLRYRNFGFRLGEIQCIFITREQAIINCITQQNYGSDGKQYVDYLAIETCLAQVYKLVKEQKFTVAIPKIGAGLGGGDWNKIEEIINRVFHDYKILVYTGDYARKDI